MSSEQRTEDRRACWKCGRDVRVNPHGFLARHNIPKATSWSRGKARKCPASGTHALRMPPELAAAYHGDIDGDLEGYDGA